MATIWKYFLVILFCVKIVSSYYYPNDYKLQLIQMIYRHGDRTPIYIYPNDPNPKSTWTKGKGQLTRKGEQQHHGLGRQLRHIYYNFITTDPTEIEVYSDVDDRCIDSAAANLQTFYAPKGVRHFRKKFNSPPIPINHTSEKTDPILSPNAPCPKAEMLMMKSNLSPESQATNEKHKELYDILSEKSGKDIKNWFDLVKLYDTLFIEKVHNCIIPPWVEPHWSEMLDIAEKVFLLLFKDPELQRLKGGPVLGLIIDKMVKKSKGDLPSLKVQVYSAHDFTVAVVLQCLNLLKKEIIPYAANLIFELYTGPQGGEFVRLLYFNSPQPGKVRQQPHVLVLDGCEELCPLSYFINYSKDKVPQNLDEECKL